MTLNTMHEHTTSWYKNYTFFFPTTVLVKFIRYNMVVLQFRVLSTVQNEVHTNKIINKLTSKNIIFPVIPVLKLEKPNS
jgi:hypothetical protein